jgi:hypothetical protein
MASRVAAELRKDDLAVETKRGGLGEFSVSVNGQKVIETNRLLYPIPGRVIKKVRSLLSA